MSYADRLMDYYHNAGPISYSAQEFAKRIAHGENDDRDYMWLFARAEAAEKEIERLRNALEEIADQAGTNRNADWARRKALEVLKGGEE